MDHSHSSNMISAGIKWRWPSAFVSSVMGQWLFVEVPTTEIQVEKCPRAKRSNLPMSRDLAVQLLFAV